jgi:hypothetical protein
VETERLTKYADIQITKKSYDPETETLTLNVDCIEESESEYIELNFNLSSFSDMQK